MSNFLSLVAEGNFINILKRYSDLALALLVVLVVGLLIVPVPTFVIDLLICANISIAMIMLLVSLYVTEALELSSFPTILLIATLFRLGINVATARLILLDADAGQVIQAFGEFVVQGNLVVGIVIFLLLMLINMLVISKGSERVAEVAARFTLDAMPGKQMSIDADLRNGSIDLEQARKKRIDLSKESQLFGAMDGAMKYVKGDIIAGIIIFAINIIAGIIIGVFQKGMTSEEAIQTYAILSVGDGLVSIIPAILMSVCAGLIVTRVSSGEKDSNIGKDVANQILAQPKAFAIAAAFIGLIGQIPGLPRVPFTLIALCVGGIAYGLYKNKGRADSGDSGIQTLVKSRDKKLELEKKSAVEKAKAQEGQTQKMMPVVTPIALEVASDLVPLVDDTSNFLGELIPMMRDGLYYELGVRFPGIRVRGNDGTLSPGSYIILLSEIPLVVGKVNINKYLVNDTPDRLRLLGIDATPAQNPANGIACAWIPADKHELAEQAGLTTWDAASYMVLHLSAVLRKNAAEFVGIQEVQNMLDQLDQAYPALVKEVVPKAVSVFQLTDILKRLAEEEILIRDLRAILQALAEWGPVESDPVMLTEQVRAALKRYISHKYSSGQNTLVVYLLDPQIEETIRSSIQHTASGNYLALEPEVTQELLSAVRQEIGNLPPSAQQPVVLTTQEIRRYFRKLVELEFPNLAVLSYQELSPEMNIQPIARISLGK
ncbi:MAG: type III secretion system export apparatus subunit SctV [bacterium]|nr:type III secretion system export apparatus subunit SctV [bacterium]